MIGRGRLLLAAFCLFPWGAAGAGELSVVLRLEGTAARLRQPIEEELARTPMRHRLAAEPDGDVLAELVVNEVGEAAPIRLRPLATGSRATPGWLVHAALRAGEAIGVGVGYGGGSWIEQLVFASTLDPADGGGWPRLRFEVPDDPSTVRLLAATVRRLDALDGAPLWEDRFLVAFDRVWLRRDLYWLGLVLWGVLWTRQRSSSSRDLPLREFRWATAAAWLVAPAAATVLLSAPIVSLLVPGGRWWRAVALLPTGAFAIAWSGALLDGSTPRISVLPALLVAGGLVTFVICAGLVPRREGDGSKSGSSAG